MSWDALLMRFPEGLGIDDVPKDWKPPAIGAAETVKAIFEETFPGQRHRLGETCVNGDGFYVQFNYRDHSKRLPDPSKIVPVEEHDLIESIGVRSNGGFGALEALKLACEKLGCRMIDFQTGELADFAEATESSMNEFMEYRLRNSPRSDDDEGVAGAE